jgi:hypothetical protein
MKSQKTKQVLVTMTEDELIKLEELRRAVMVDGVSIPTRAALIRHLIAEAHGKFPGSMTTLKGRAESIYHATFRGFLEKQPGFEATLEALYARMTGLLQIGPEDFQRIKIEMLNESKINQYLDDRGIYMVKLL